MNCAISHVSSGLTCTLGVAFPLLHVFHRHCLHFFFCEGMGGLIEIACMLICSFSGYRLNKEPPNLTFRKKDKGGINLTSTVTNTHLDLETVKAICSEYRMHNADITLRYDATADDLIDVIEGSRIYMPCIYVVNKIDQITLEELEILDKLPHYCPVRYAFCPYLKVCCYSAGCLSFLKTHLYDIIVATYRMSLWSSTFDR